MALGLGAATILVACGHEVTDPRTLHDGLLPIVAAAEPTVRPEVAEFIPDPRQTPAAPAFEPQSRSEVRRALVPEAERRAVVLGHQAGQSIDTRIFSAFHGAQSQIRCDVVACTDREVVEMLMIGRADFGLIGGQLSRREIHAGLREHRIAVELFALSVAPTSPLRSLNRRQIRQIFTGEITQWRQLGFEGGDIVPVVPRDKELAERAQRVLIPGDRFAASCVQIDSERQLIEQLQQNPDAIGVVRVTEEPRQAGQKLIQIEWSPPTPVAFDYGTYPFGIPLQLVTSGKPTAEAMSLVEFLRRGDGRELLAPSHCFVP